MARRHVPYEVREEFFDLVCSGMPLEVASAVVGVSATTATTAWWRASGLVEPGIQMGRHGGLPGTTPLRWPGEQRGELQRRMLTSEERSVIAAGLLLGASHAQIGVLIGRDKSVICREIARNRGPDGSYWGPIAHRAAHERRRRTKEFRLIAEPGLCRRIEEWMDQGWSPKLIARVLREESPHMIMGRVSPPGDAPTPAKVTAAAVAAVTPRLAPHATEPTSPSPDADADSSPTPVHLGFVYLSFV